MNIFPPDPTLEEEIFTVSNIDKDCDTIGELIHDYGSKFIEPALGDGMYAIAVRYYLRLLDSLSFHFVADEHWTFYDDFYSPDYAVSDIWEKFIPHIHSGALAGDDLIELEDGLRKIEQSEAYTNYGIPSLIPFGDLKNARPFLERFKTNSIENLSVRRRTSIRNSR